MNTLLVNKNKLIYKEEQFELNDLFTDELYKFSDENVEKYCSELCIVNEVFLSRVQPIQALMLFIMKNKVEIIKFKNADNSLIPLLVDVAKLCNIEIKNIPFLFKQKRKILTYVNIIGSMLYLMWQMLIKPQTDRPDTQNEKISIIRTQAAKNKIKLFKDIFVNFENFDNEKTIYNCFSRRKRVEWILKAWIYSYNELKKYKIMIIEFVGLYSALDSVNYYSKRVIHTLVYSYILESYFSVNRGKTFYSGNNLDRYALLEEEIAKKYNVKTICIPHGLEYGFKLPHCFTCDVFYATSAQAARHLNKLYSTNKFLYDFNTVQKMFVVQYNGVIEKRIVFFTEPREVYVNLKIIDQILPLMEKRKMRLSIKLHPKDKRSDYIEYDNKVNFIQDFDEAVSGNICFSRKSTTLLEAVYNGSKAGAILINPKDKAVFNTFPSLNDDKIEVFYSTDDLFDWLNSEYLKCDC